MKISHDMPVEEWAFKYVVENLAKQMPEHEHKVNCRDGSADVRNVMTPNMFKAFRADGKTVLHLDGNRWYENFIINEGDKK